MVADAVQSLFSYSSFYIIIIILLALREFCNTQSDRKMSDRALSSTSFYFGSFHLGVIQGGVPRTAGSLQLLEALLSPDKKVLEIASLCSTLSRSEGIHQTKNLVATDIRLNP